MGETGGWERSWREGSQIKTEMGMAEEGRTEETLFVMTVKRNRPGVASVWGVKCGFRGEAAIKNVGETRMEVGRPPLMKGTGWEPGIEPALRSEMGGATLYSKQAAKEATPDGPASETWTGLFWPREGGNSCISIALPEVCIDRVPRAVSYIIKGENLNI